MTKLRISCVLAIGFGAVLVVGETLRNWNAWGEWETYTFDYLFAALLLAFGTLTLRERTWARIGLAVTWVLTISLFTLSFVDHLQHLADPTYGLIPQIPLTIIIGTMDLIALVALILGLWPRK